MIPAALAICKTRLIMRPLRNTERVLTNAAVEEILTIERDKGAVVPRSR